MRAGVVVALIAGALVTVFPNPASADAPTVNIFGFSNGTLSPGQNATMQFRVTNPNSDARSVTISVSSSFDELTCTQGCDQTLEFQATQTREFTAQFRAGNVADGQSKSGQAIAKAEISGLGGGDDDDSRAVTVRGNQAQQPPPVQTVKLITGKITNQSDGKAVNNAYVALGDGAGKLHEDFADDNGVFRFEGSAQKPIAPGRITIGASKDDFKQNTKSINVNAGGTASGVVIALQLENAPTPSTSAVPTEEAPVDEAPTDEPTDGAAAAPVGNSEDGGGFGNWLVVLGGGLLVAFGVGGIVWVMLRRKENDDPDDETSTTGVRPAVPAGGAAGYRGNDATRIAGPGGGALADAPTMLHSRAPMDEFPDPYGAPMPSPQPPSYGGGTQPGWGAAGAGGYGQPTQAGGYDQSTQMYDAAPPTQFGNAPGSGGGYGAGGYPEAPGSGGGGYGGAPASGGGYGAAPGGGYPQAGGGYGERFDEPTGRYQPTSGGPDYGPQGGGYGQPAGGGYGGAANGYGDERGYGAEPNGYDAGGAGTPAGGYGGAAPRGGYDQGRGGYEAGGYGGAAPAGGYGGAAPAGGYDETRGYPAGGADYDRGGYEAGPPPGYDRVPEQRGGGNYGGPNGGYADQGDYYPPEGGGEGRARHGADGARGAEGGRSTDRRQLGWLDD
jgi:hypothetical protein